MKRETKDTFLFHAKTKEAEHISSSFDFRFMMTDAGWIDQLGMSSDQ